MKKRVTKKAQVLAHLKKNKYITAIHAVSLYGAYRLSSIIHKLRDEGFDIETQINTAKDRNGNTVNYAKYIYKS